MLARIALEREYSGNSQNGRFHDLLAKVFVFCVIGTTQTTNISISIFCLGGGRERWLGFSGAAQARMAYLGHPSRPDLRPGALALQRVSFQAQAESGWYVAA